jgi:hypothetical protein
MSLQTGSDVASNAKIEVVIFATYSKLEVANFKSAQARIQRFQAFALLGCSTLLDCLALKYVNERLS